MTVRSYAPVMPAVGGLVRCTDGSWMTRPPQRCPRGHRLRPGHTLAMVECPGWVLAIQAADATGEAGNMDAGTAGCGSVRGAATAWAGAGGAGVTRADGAGGIAATSSTTTTETTTASPSAAVPANRASAVLVTIEALTRTFSIICFVAFFISMIVKTSRSLLLAVFWLSASCPFGRESPVSVQTGHRPTIWIRPHLARSGHTRAARSTTQTRTRATWFHSSVSSRRSSSNRPANAWRALLNNV